MPFICSLSSFIHSTCIFTVYCVSELAGVRDHEKDSDLAWSDGGDRHAKKGLELSTLSTPIREMEVLVKHRAMA